ncbi:uncharacterized protein LOC115473015 isoform X2 [Microcaecilia unicolor]|uniref:Uncharacterized protein LOC115473015 isoform X2 n=1 Tax=Microcaecilia unicolor TaxID=1415580 RepID=A0A6P7YEU4_9AMPH|nr:uncharacterized protein LOC115473015 isoform X2 [Microcaecilia unicolor]
MAGIWVFCGFFLIISLEEIASQSCPGSCKFCTIQLAECEHISSLKSVLSGLPILTEQILLRNGNLSIIPPGSFQNFSHLQLLSVTGFMISSLTNQTFVTKDGESTLKALDLSRNHLFSCGVATSAFSGLGTLKELILSDNALDSLKRSWWSDMSLLQKLVISANKVTNLPPRVFENLTQLNQLTMPSNLIQYLITDTFYNLVSLTELDLSKNEIIFISEDAFHPLQELKHLKLFENRLVTLPSITDSVTSLFLNGNLWNCSCKLVRMLRSMEKKVQNPTDLLCESPENVKNQQLLKAEPEVCVFAPPEEEDLPSQSTFNMYSVYGFLGGLFFTLMIWLVVYSITSYWRSNKRTTSPTAHEDLKCNLKAETSMAQKSANALLAFQCPTKCESWKMQTDYFQTEHETNSLEKPPTEPFSQTSKDIDVHPSAALSRQPFNSAVVPWDLVDKMSKVPKQSRPSDQYVGTFQSLDEEAEKMEGIPKCASAPVLLPTLDDPKMLSSSPLFSIAEVPKNLSRKDWLPIIVEPEISQKADLCPVTQDLRDFPASDLRARAEQMSPKSGVGLLVTPFNDEKAMHLIKMMDTESGLKYFETQHEENVVTCSDVPPPPTDALEIATYHPESMVQMKANRELGQRSKTWSTFYGISSEPIEKQEDGKYDGYEVCLKKLEVSPVSSTREQSIKLPKNDKSTDLSDEESISEKDLVEFFYSKEQFSSYSSESCDERDTEDLEDVDSNSTPVASLPSTPTKLQKPRGTTKVRTPIHKGTKMSTYETNLSSPYLRQENTQQKSMGKERLHRKHRNRKRKQGFLLPSDRLTKERFWKYHKNCCDEYKPCATAKKVLKYIKTASPEQLDNESTQRPPSDLDLLEDQSTTLPLPSKSINGKEDSLKLQKKTLKNKNCISFPSSAMHLAHGEFFNTGKQPNDKSILCGTPHFIEVKPAPQAGLPENQLGSVDLTVHDQCGLPEDSVAKQMINVCDVISELPSTAGNKKPSLCITSEYRPTKPNSDVLLTPSICAGANPVDGGKRRTKKIPDVFHAGSPVKACLQLSKVAFSKTAASVDEISLACGSDDNILLNVREVPEYSKRIHEDVCIDKTRLPSQQHWLHNMDYDHEVPSLLRYGKHGSILHYHRDKLLAQKKRENQFQTQRNAGIVQLKENGQHISDMLTAKESRLRKHSGEMSHGSLIQNNSVLNSSSCSNKLSVTYVCDATDNPCNIYDLYKNSLNQQDELENSISRIETEAFPYKLAMLKPQNLRHVTQNENGHVNDGKCFNPKRGECLIDSNDQLYVSDNNDDSGRDLGHLEKFENLEMDENSELIFTLEQNCEFPFQKDSSINSPKEIKQSLNDCLPSKLSRRTYRSVFKLPVGDTSWNEFHKSEHSNILPPIPESERYMKTFPSPDVLEIKSTVLSGSFFKSEDLAMESVAKMAYISSLYKAKPSRKFVHNFFQKLDDSVPEISELSVLSNLHFCKIAEEMTVNMKNEEGAKQFQDHEDEREQFQKGKDNAPSKPILSSNSGCYKSPTRQELSADSELSLMNILCSLKSSFEHSGVLLKSSKLDE